MKTKLKYGYDVRCPDCKTPAKYFAVWRSVNFYCTTCKQAKCIPLYHLGELGKAIDYAQKKGIINFDLLEELYERKEIETSEQT